MSKAPEITPLKVVDVERKDKPELFEAVMASCKVGDIAEAFQKAQEREKERPHDDQTELCELKRIVTLSNEDFVRYMSFVMYEYDFLKDTEGCALGGTGSTADIPKYKHLEDTPQAYFQALHNDKEAFEQWRAEAYGLVIKIENEDHDQYFYVNPEGYNYARYVNLPLDPDTNRLLKYSAEKTELEEGLEVYRKESYAIYDSLRDLNFNVRCIPHLLKKLGIDADTEKVDEAFNSFADSFRNSHMDAISDKGDEIFDAGYKKIQKLQKKIDAMKTLIASRTASQIPDAEME